VLEKRIIVIFGRMGRNKVRILLGFGIFYSEDKNREPEFLDTIEIPLLKIRLISDALIHPNVLKNNPETLTRRDEGRGV
jgi:hypothetical protein